MLRHTPGADVEWEDLLTGLLPVDASLEVVRIYDVIINDLNRIHLALARDLFGATMRGAAGGTARIFEPSREFDRLDRHRQALADSLARIGNQPSTALVRDRMTAAIRPGDRVDHRVLDELLMSPDVIWKNRRPKRVGRIRTERPRLTLDIPEHRHLRAGLERLTRRAVALRDGCERAADLIELDRKHWDVGSSHGQTIFEERYLPRIQKLRALAAAGNELALGFRKLAGSYEFLATADQPRTRFGPTALFLGRRPYREAYNVLVSARRERGVMMDGTAMLVSCRNLDTLYEYWVFISVVKICRERFGPPLGQDKVELIDEIYRPDLRPGQFFEWRLPDGERIRVYYEPAIPPFDWGQAGPFGWRAVLAGAPLRPDVMVVQERPGCPVRAFVFDAKNTTQFKRSRLFDYSDYRTMILDPATGTQPVRAAMFVHRDPNGVYCSLPGLLDGDRTIPNGTSVLGSICHDPDRRRSLSAALEAVLCR